MTAIPELSSVILTREVDIQFMAPHKDYPIGHKLMPGQRGVVMLVHGRGEAYEVEFFSLEGDTIAVETVSADRLRMAE